MKRSNTLTAFAVTIILAAGHAASAQVVAYHHRSTAWGDHLAGASELVRAHGAFLRDEADAAETWVRATAAHDNVLYQRAEYRWQLKHMYDEYLNDKANARRERNAAETAAHQAEALRLWQAAQRGFVVWPAALRRAEYANSVSLIESILRSWSPANPTGDAYRRALATEAGVLRTRIAENTNIDFLARVEAVQTLQRVQSLAEMTGVETAAALAMR
jgi:hypothetical protein